MIDRDKIVEKITKFVHCGRCPRTILVSGIFEERCKTMKDAGWKKNGIELMWWYACPHCSLAHEIDWKIGIFA